MDPITEEKEKIIPDEGINDVEAPDPGLPTVPETEPAEEQITESDPSESETSASEESDQEKSEDISDAEENSDQDEVVEESNPVPEEDAEESNPVLDAINELSGKVELLSKQFDAKIMHTAHEEKIVDQMHAELQKYKEDMYSQLVRPILLDIIEMRDSIMRMSQAYSEKPAEEQVIPLKTFSDYAYDVQDILEKNNISIYKSEEGDSFTPIRQRVTKKVSTPVEELHGKIAESMSDGYEYLGKTISPEKIAVYVYEASEKKEGEQE